MGTTRGTKGAVADPFAGLPPQPVRCRWLSSTDAARAKSAEVIRLIVDDQRGSTETHAANEVYQRQALREIQDFIGPTRALLVTPAGMISTYMSQLSPSLSSI